MILEPFTATVSGSFNKDDILASHLLDAALRRLAARALRRRVRGFRDLLDGAVFSGRKWTMASKSAPMVEVPELTSVEFDKENRIIMTGRAQVRTSPSSLLMENTFKLRTKIGTRSDGQCIRLVEPELAFVLECPRSWEKKYVAKEECCFGLDCRISLRYAHLFPLFAVSDYLLDPRVFLYHHGHSLCIHSSPFTLLSK